MYRRAVLSLLVCLLWLPAPVAATVVLPVSDQALAEHAAAIVIGRVVSMQGLYEPQQQKVVTDVRVALDEVLAGNLPHAEITLRQLGGVAGTLLSQVYGSPEFFIGEKVLLFLRQRPDGSLRVAHLYQGKFSIHTDPTSGEEYVFRSVPSGVALWRRPDAGAAAPVQRDDSHWLRDFLDRIRAFIPEDRRRPLEGDGRGQAAVAPETSSDPTEVRAEFTYLVPSAPARWFEPDSGTAVTVRVHEAGEPLAPTGGVDQVRQALQAWSTVSGSTFRFQDGGDTSAAGFRRDDVNAVSFGDPDGDMDAPVNCGGTLAIGGYFATSNQRTINGQVFTRIVEGDVVFANGWAGCGFYETFANLAEVATHELGHTLGLGHSNDTTATMYMYAHFDGRGASLRDDDKNGLRFIYPPFTLTVSKSGNGSGTVISNPSAIDCGGTCSADFSYNATVTLTATPVAGSTFGGWSGACAGTGPCAVFMTQARNVTATFALATTPPPAATLVSPTATIATTTPTYTWNSVTGASNYYLWVNNGGTSGKIKEWYTAAQAGCGAGTGTCSVTPTTALVGGSSAWYIQTANSVGYGPWSAAMSFMVNVKPAAATLVSPMGTITNTAPTYTWNAVSPATYYYLWVNDAAQDAKLQTWYTAAQAGCAVGTGTCSVTPSVPLAYGATQWWIQTWNPAGYGPWSAGKAFTVSSGTLPTAATILSPIGSSVTATPTYTWTAVLGATWYYLWVDDSSTPGTAAKVLQWYTAAQAGCGAGTGTCSVTPSTALAFGAAEYWIRTWNSTGYGPWSNGVGFTVSGP